ncbi:relaxase domain-containing protein [Gephyromycinifex aptenodytis]|uniref:relaxase domain-containing protein n=1 Tax=Gephyromycinifex aptenodytis TaxID=2716227 RepID=UPI003855E5C4
MTPPSPARCAGNCSALRSSPTEQNPAPGRGGPWVAGSAPPASRCAARLGFVAWQEVSRGQAEAWFSQLPTAPSGEVLGAKAREDGLPGWDLTVSAPKAASLLRASGNRRPSTRPRRRRAWWVVVGRSRGEGAVARADNKALRGSRGAGEQMRRSSENIGSTRTGTRTQPPAIRRRL